MQLTCQDLETQARLLANAYREIVELNGTLAQSQAWNRKAQEELAQTQRELGFARERIDSACSSEFGSTVEVHGNRNGGGGS